MSAGDGIVLAPATRDAGESPGTSTFYATSSGTVYHRHDCAVIAHHPEDLRVLGADGTEGMQPCQICPR